jgi:hypothetical protein
LEIPTYFESAANSFLGYQQKTRDSRFPSQAESTNNPVDLLGLCRAYLANLDQPGCGLVPTDADVAWSVSGQMLNRKSLIDRVLGG